MKYRPSKCKLPTCGKTFIPTTRGQLCCCRNHGGIYRFQQQDGENYRAGQLQDIPTAMYGIQYEDMEAA